MFGGSLKCDEGNGICIQQLAMHPSPIILSFRTLIIPLTVQVLEFLPSNLKDANAKGLLTHPQLIAVFIGVFFF